MEPSRIDLNIRGENVQELYNWYLDGRLVVNRRYQRKLVWTKDEKAHLVDTIVRRFPLPLILLAEVEIDRQPRFEIIDGMQRLNAIFSFIENRLDFAGKYFDLETMASSKQLRDEGKLSQSQPTLDRHVCAAFANYKIPLSTYKIDRADEIDEIFRRINSYGRVLSDHEIRQAGVTGTFSDLVRTIAAEVRGDVSHGDVLLLNRMDSISITNRELDYGVKVDDIFWVRQGVLLREDIRDSRDEEMIADLVSYVVSPDRDKPSSSRQTRDAFYGRPKNSTADARKRALTRKGEIDALVSRHGPSILQKTFLQTFDLIREIWPDPAGFRNLLRHASPNYGTPRYFQAVFLALYDLQYTSKLKLADLVGIRETLRNLDDHVQVSTGGNWGAPNRVRNVSVVKGLVEKHFTENPDDPVAQIGRTEFINLLTKSKTEAASYEFKQGLHRLDERKAFDDAAFNGILETICALANLGKGKVGYLVIGVADKKADAERVKQLYGVKPEKAGHFYVVGVDREATAFHTDMDRYLQFVSDRIGASGLSEATRLRVTSQLSVIDYNGLSAIVIRVESGPDPCFLGDRMYRRRGAQTVLVPPQEIIQVGRLFS